MMKRPAKGPTTDREIEKPDLRAEAHREVMDYLRLAERSPNADIRKAALDIAKGTSKHQRSQNAKVSPTLITILATAIVISAAAACWFAFLRYPEKLAYEISGLVMAFVLIIIAVYTLLSGNLSQENFMQVIDWVLTRIGYKKSSEPTGASPNQDHQLGTLHAESDHPPHDES